MPTAMTKTCESTERSGSVAWLLMNAIVLPSGDQAGALSSNAPVVSASALRAATSKSDKWLCSARR
jgi:hypothetical protein